jgi:hypothetical protein
MPFPLQAVLPAVIGTAGSLLGGALDRSQQEANQARQFQYDKALADHNFQQNLNMWNLQNQYNSPSMQMQRFKEAGLNPNLIYGQGSAGLASSSPKYEQASQDVSLSAALNVPALLSVYNDFVVKQAQVDNLKANTEARMVQVANDTLKGVGLRYEAEQAPERSRLRTGLLEEQKDLTAGKRYGQAYINSMLGTRSSVLNQYLGAETKLAMDLKLATLNNMLAKTEGQRISNRWNELGVSNPINLLTGLAGKLLPRGINRSIRKQ